MQALALVVSSIVVFAAPAGFTIQGDAKIGAFAAARAPKLPAARAVFGAPSSVRKLSETECRAVWRGRGLSMVLLDLNGTNAPCQNGNFVQGTVIGRAWQTSKGLRIGDSIAQLRKLFPAARLHTGVGPDSGWWLVERRFCAEVGGDRFPGLLARVSGGKVSAFVLRLGVCE